jgi:hypothetical protein
MVEWSRDQGVTQYLSHSSEIKFLSWRTDVDLVLFFLWFSFLSCSLVLRLFDSDCYFLTSGASSPEWVKPTAEGGGLFVAFLCFCVRLLSTMLCIGFCFLRACFIFVHIAFMADGR